MKKNLTLALLLIITLILPKTLSAAEPYEVAPVTSFFADYKAKYLMILEAIEKLPPETTLAERMAFYDIEINKLKNRFRTERTAEYKSKVYTASVTNSCTSKASGGVKKCGTKYVYAPINDMYTQKEYTSVAGTNKGVSISSDGRSAGLRMTVAGKGKNVGTLTAEFRYHPDRITINVDRDLTSLFSSIAQK